MVTPKVVFQGTHTVPNLTPQGRVFLTSHCQGAQREGHSNGSRRCLDAGASHGCVAPGVCPGWDADGLKGAWPSEAYRIGNGGRSASPRRMQVQGFNAGRNVESNLSLH
jgi:hypothetical protein